MMFVTRIDRERKVLYTSGSEGCHLAFADSTGLQGNIFDADTTGGAAEMTI